MKKWMKEKKMKKAKKVKKTTRAEFKMIWVIQVKTSNRQINMRMELREVKRSGLGHTCL